MMSGIRAKDTRPELIIRRGLHRSGFRYRLHSNQLAGKPDIVLPKFKAVIFVHGCFWHGHACELFKWPKSRAEFWRQKITRNIGNDVAVLEALRVEGWRTAIVWECSMKGRKKRPIIELIDRLANWLSSSELTLELAGVD